MNEPDPPGQLPLQPPGRRPGGWKRGLVITALAALCAVFGMFSLVSLTTAVAQENVTLGGVAMITGFCLGLAGGIWLGFWAVRERRHP